MSDLLKLDFNERSDYLSPLARDSAFEQLWKYPERECLELQIATQYGLDPVQVLCTNGGDEGIMLLMRIIKETAQLILPLPAFSQYTWGVESWQLSAKIIPAQSDLTIDLAAARRAIEESSGTVTIITRPNNPTGELIEFNALLAVIETAAQNDSWVFLDEAYIEFCLEPTSPMKLLSQFNNLVILRTFSKAVGLAGIRVGYLMGSAQLIAQFRNRCMPFNVPTPCLALASQALSNEIQTDIQNYVKVIQSNRQQLAEWFCSIGITVVPSEANFLLIRLPVSQAIALKSFLFKQDISVRIFDRDELQGCVRITIPYSLDRLLPFLEQILAPKLICLDMDGVLIDTSNSYDQAVQQTVSALSQQPVSLADIFELRNAGGFNNDWVLSQALLKQQGVNKSLSEVTEVFQSLYLGKNGDGLVSNEKCLLAPSLKQKINQACLQQFAIVTGRPRAEAMAGIQLVGLEGVQLISLDDVTEAKPSPEGIKQLQCQFSSKSWMCGDNPDDMQAAKGSNSLAIGIGSENASSLYAAGADVVLASINQLEDWFRPVN